MAAVARLTGYGSRPQHLDPLHSIPPGLCPDLPLDNPQWDLGQSDPNGHSQQENYHISHSPLSTGQPKGAFLHGCSSHASPRALAPPDSTSLTP